MDVKKKRKKGELDYGYASPTSSPPTPPSPLPVSVGPGDRRYSFSLSPSPSPPFSPAASQRDSAELLPLFTEEQPGPKNQPSTFSLDRRAPEQLDSGSTCLEDLLIWFIERCCNACSTATKSNRNLLPDTL